MRVRIVALNRPGYGPSTFQPDYSFLDWPVDVSAAADLLGIDRFAVVGASGGSPYALACGYALRRRVASVGIVVGVAPLEATGMRTSLAITSIPATHAGRRLVYGLVAAGAWSPLRRWLLDVVHREMAGADRKFFATTRARPPCSLKSFARLCRTAAAPPHARPTDTSVVGGSIYAR